MSTEHFMSRICKSPGRFTFALLLGVLLALPCLTPAAVFARASGQTGAHSLSSSLNLASPVAVRDKVGVSVVRLIATYSAPRQPQVTCTGLGVLVASQPPSGTNTSYVNWILTDGNLISTGMSECGKLGNKLPLNTVDILASTEYTGSQVVHLDTLNCQPVAEQEICNSPLHGGVGTIINPTTTDTSYTLLSFQSPTGQPSVTLSSTSSSPLNVGLIKPSSSVYQFKQTDGKESPTGYLTPSLVGSPGSSPGTSNNSSSQAATNPIEGGTPEVNVQGQMVGMWMTNGTGGYTSVAAETLQQILVSHNLLLSTSSQTCATVAGCWDLGIDAFYAKDYAAAHTTLSKAYQLNPQFTAAHVFDILAVKLGRGEGGGNDNANRQSTFTGLFDAYPWVGYVAAAVLVLLLLLIVVLALRAQKKRRELKKFNEEVEESRRIAAAQVAQQQLAAQPPKPTQAPCPNCRTMVNLTDVICPKCRYPLSPTASGMGVRLVGNAPRISAPLPPLPPQSPFVDQPTMQMLPGSPLPVAAELNEPTLTRAELQNAGEPKQFIQQMRGRNLSLAVGTRTDPGIKRKHKPNEDSMFAARWGDAQFGLFVVADGMGGHANGQDASRLAIQTMIDFMLPKVTDGEARNDEAFLKLLENGVQASNQAVHNRNMESHADMGTTMTSALVVGSTAYVANVGDSRTYLYREGEGLSKVTHDHSVVASLVDAGIIKPDDIYTHPKRNQIYRSLGEKSVVEVDTFPVQLQPGDKLMLCSDGLWDMVRDPLIQDVLAKTTRDPDETGQNLITAALDGGGEDNVSVIVIQLAETNEHTSISGVQLLAKPESVTFPNVIPR